MVTYVDARATMMQYLITQPVKGRVHAQPIKRNVGLTHSILGAHVTRKQFLDFEYSKGVRLFWADGIR